jgi:hypothetical protein
VGALALRSGNRKEVWQNISGMESISHNVTAACAMHVRTDLITDDITIF